MPRNHLHAEFSNVHIVTLAVFTVGGGTFLVDTEDAAVAAHRIAPERFAWRKYPEQVNLELVRVCLSDAKKPGKELLNGSGTKGWSLTPKGLEWARLNESRLSVGVTPRERGHARGQAPTERRWRAERSRLLALESWRLWQSGTHRLSTVGAREVFRIDSYADDQVRNLKITRLLALFADDIDLRPFLEAAATAVQSVSGG